MSKKPLVFVGVSGGVDSSVSAALLLEQGYDVVGVFIKTWQPQWVTCTWRDEKRDAMRVCAHLGIPFLFFDFEKEYKKGVADYMIEEYKKGRTPNPDVMCNKEIKFGAFYKKARAMGADFIATGHYAQNFIHPSAEKDSIRNRLSLPSYARRAPTPTISAGTFSALGAGFDKGKDQSYFLWTIPQEVLARTLFPVGHLEKSDVRKLAAKYKLPTATKKDSQGICFIGPVDMKEFLSHYIKTKKGDVLNENGKVIGTHDGSIFYTLGERHGFTITKKSPHDAPYFVIGKDLKKNTITVSENKYQKLLRTTLDNSSKGSPCWEITLSECNWISEMPEVGKTYDIRLRYRETLSKAKIISISKTSAKLELLKKEVIDTPGQSAVLYDKEICLGGGIIE